MGGLRLNPGGVPEANRKLAWCVKKTGRGLGRVNRWAKPRATVGEVLGVWLVRCEEL